MGKEIHNNHFIQKGFVKEFFSGVKEIDYTRLGTNESGKIEIDSYDSALVIKDFHTDEIETGMNLLEDQGLALIKKINKQMNNGKVALNRIETMTLRFYLILGLIRSSAARSDIKNKNGDEMFNGVVSKSSGNSQEIQEEKVAELLKMYKAFKDKTDYTSEFTNFMGSAFKSNDAAKYIEENLSNKLSVHMIFHESLSSRLMFFKFDEGNLLLEEKLSFQEISRVNSPRSIYSFFPVNEKHGIMLINKSGAERVMGSKQETSKAFKSDLASMHHVEYKKIEEIKLALARYLHDNNLGLTNENQAIWSIKHAGKFYTDKDKYIYEIQRESREVADFCNAMMSVHNAGAITMFSSPEDVSRMYRTKDFYGIYDIATDNR